MSARVRRLRSLLSVPGGSERFLTKARDVPADAVAFDLEDSVAVGDKERARRLVAAALPDFPAEGRELWVRPNALDSGLLEADLDALVGPALHGLHLPKVDDGRTLAQVDHYLTYLERVRSLTAGSIRLMAWIESPAALGRLEEICRATPRLDAVSLGSEDYTAALGVPRSADGEELGHARARLANAAAAAGIGALDGPETNFRAADRFRVQARRARAVGLTGKFCIHPDQVALAHEEFAPTAHEVARATRVVTAYEALGEGAGAVAVDGEMVDRPGYLRALRTLAH
ncbi:CoA ester lyase [Streptomyces sp. NPDC047315]|uniref:HpcH/HpaI aldolase/citrate lyase family protein n=1 Tax=Streptomyces sp. NPDC047315 TaxID=3155142 RepID=UPI00340B3BE3